MNKTLAVLIMSTAVLGTAACSSTRTQRAPGEQVDDAALLTSVKSALAADSTANAADVNVDVNRGEVKLSGFVDSASHKARAAEVARDVDGVKSVQNDIAVGESSTAGEVIDDSVLTAKVKTALIANDADQGSPDQRGNQGQRRPALRLRGQRSGEVSGDQRRQIRHWCEGRQERAERQVVLTPPRTLEQFTDDFCTTGPRRKTRAFSLKGTLTFIKSGSHG